MQQQISIDLINRATFERESVIKHYCNVETLHQTEKVILEKLLPKIKNSDILDIGIGGGRTTHYLSAISPGYVGIDYVPKFAEEAARKYPDATILCMDATALGDFADESFDFVLFSYNGIDCLSPGARLLALKEIHRVLRTGGHFMFSTHNREYKNFKKPPWRRKPELNAKFVKFLAYSLFFLPKHWAMKKHEVDTDEYALVNDCDHRYSILFYYVSPEKQTKQLEDIGFSQVEVYDNDGTRVRGCKSSLWLDYLAVKS